jgi:H+/Cl- antiporter ClcA
MPNMKEEIGDYTADSRLLVTSAMALGIGAISGLIAWVLLRLIALVTNLAYYHRLSIEPVTAAGHHLGAWAVLVPVAGGLIIGVLARYGSPKIRGHGIPEALEAILIGRSRMDIRVAILKPVASAIAIGTGGPFGAEGPIIMTGGAFGSLFAQGFHLTSSERKTLLVAGAAAGMSAIFDAPFAAVMLSVELLLFEWKPRSFIPAAVAAVTAWAVRAPLLGAGPVFPVTPHGAFTPPELLAAAGLGLLAGAGGTLLTLMVYGVEDVFSRLPIHWMWWPAIGALFVGVGGLIEPRALGVGYDVIRDLLDGRVIGSALIAFLLVKAVIWAVALGSGTSGGVLAPLLLIGGALGAIVARVVPVGDAGLWALVGMAAMMGGTMGAPLTAVAFLLELTGDLTVGPGLLVACIAASLVTVLVLRRSILTEKVARRGHHVAREYSVSPLTRLRVRDVMEQPVPILSGALPLAALLEGIAAGDPVLAHRHSWPVLDVEGHLTGILTRGDLVRAQARQSVGAPTLSEIATPDPVVAYPDELLETAVVRMVSREVGRLPVVARDRPLHPIGLLDRAAITSAWAIVAEEEGRREAGWLSAPWRRIRRRVRQGLRRQQARRSGAF